MDLHLSIYSQMCSNRGVYWLFLKRTVRSGMYLRRKIFHKLNQRSRGQRVAKYVLKNLIKIIFKPCKVLACTYFEV